MVTNSFPESRSLVRSAIIPSIPYRRPEEERHPKKYSEKNLNTFLNSRKSCN